MFDQLKLKCFDSPTGCGGADVMMLFSNGLKFMIWIGLLIAFLTVGYAGYILITGKGNPSAVSSAKHMFWSVAIGLFLLLGAYAIVFFVVDWLTVEGAGFRKYLN